MKLLVLGGTVFLGRAIVEDALRRGHEVTLFNRGQRNPDLFPEAEKLHGDRDGGLGILAGRRWEAVIDTSAYFPRLARASAEALKDAVDRYVFISTISVYADFTQVGMDENAPVGTLEDETVEQVTGETYGPLKALCEQAVEAALPGRAIIIRPGLIVGPHDQSNRFTYWPTRIARGGDVLVPRSLDWQTQIIDVRDLAAWSVTMAETGALGVYNATGPDHRLTMGDVFETSRAVAGSDARPVVIPEEFLLAAGVGPWMELPLWMPEKPELAGFSAVNCARAYAAGLTFRPLAETVRDTLAWDRTLPADAERRAGLKPERETELLQAWREKEAGETAP
jgi:2'-hydroxyisoflavone reductase